jgi:hypothetical protein
MPDWDWWQALQAIRSVQRTLAGLLPVCLLATDAVWQGQTKRDAISSLKRRVSNAVYRQLLIDTQK